MTSPAWENTQLAATLKELGAVPGTTRGVAVAGQAWWVNWPGASSDYAAMSVAPVSDGTGRGTVDTTGGDRVFDAGYGGIAN